MNTMKKRFAVASLALVVLLALFVSGCGASPKSTSAMSSSAAYAQADMAMEAPAEMPVPEAGGSADGSSVNTSGKALEDTSHKLIRRVYLGVETKEFDALSASVGQQITETGGYVESSRIEGGSKEYDRYRPRYSHTVARIPKEQVDAFIGKVGELGVIVTKEESTEDVTLQYVDVESHKKSLVIEQERLLALLEKAEKLEDIIALEQRLSDVRYQLQSYESQLRTFDNQVDYSTVTLEIREVERITPQEEKSLWSRMQTGLGSTFYDIGEGSQNFAVWFVVNLPYLLLWAVVIAVAVLILRKILRKNSGAVKENKLRGKSGKNQTPDADQSETPKE